MIQDEVRILVCGRGDELDDAFIEMMEALGFFCWAQGYPMGMRELCFLPAPEVKDEQEAASG